MFRRLSGRARRPPGKRTAPPSRHPRKTQLRFECLEERALLATFTVSALGDSPVLAPGDAPGTLRQAIFDANNSVGADVINFAPALSGTIELTAGELLITGALTIEGPGATQLTIDASTSDPTPGLNNGDGIRVFHIDDSSPAVNSPVTISGLTITGGDVNGAGGGIRSLENLALEGVVVTGNASTDNGAGVFISTAGGLNSVVRSTISGNIAPTPDDLGGGMYAFTATGGVSIVESTFSGNRGFFGGGLFARTITGSVAITSSTFSGNAAGQGGGGLYLQSSGGTAVITHSTITRNTANADMGIIGSGGGIFAEGSGTVRLDHTIVAENSDLHPVAPAPDIDGTSADATPSFDVSFSLIGDNTRSSLLEAQTPDANGNLIGNPLGVGVIDPMLAPLADNGGPTRTHAIQIGSPAVDAGNPAAIAGAAGVPMFDQRGTPFSRIREGDGIGAPRIDIGAFETSLLVLPDEFETNDSIATATVLGSLSEITLRNLTIHNEADEDFFKITAHDTGKLIVRTLFDGAVGDLDLQIVDRFGNQIALSQESADVEELIVPVVAQEMYFVRVIGFEGATNLYSLEIENFAAPVPTSVHLDPGSDLGRFNNDDLTSDVTPTFIVQADVQNFVDPDEDGVFEFPALTSEEAESGATGIAVQVRITSVTDPLFAPIIVFADPLSALSPTHYQVSLTSALPDGVYFASANTRIIDGQQDSAGEPDPATGRSNLSQPLRFTIDAAKPNVFFGDPSLANDGLDPASDTGVASQPATIIDRITSDSTPTLFGTAEANATVRVFVRTTSGGRVLVGETVATPESGNNPLPTGRWAMTSTVDMNDPLLGFTALDGLRQFEVEAEDLAGNLSPGAVFQFLDAPQPIDDDDTTEFTIDVSGLAGPITDLNVGLSITHPNVGDLDVTLISPAGTEVQLFADVGGNGDNFAGTTLDDEADTEIELGTAPFSGRFIPMELLAQFDGEDPNGTWTLRIVDDMADDAGTLDVWTLCFQSALDVFIDTQGPRISAVTAGDFDLLGHKTGPTPSIQEITVAFTDLPARTAEFLYSAINETQAITPGNYRLVGDRVGTVPITSVTFADNTVAGGPGLTSVTLHFESPLPDDRFTLTVRDNLRDDAGNPLDGEYLGAPTALPSGDGLPKGKFVVDFTLDGLPELGVWAAGTILIDANGNFASNSIGAGGDLAFHLGFSSDYVFAGNFAAPGAAADGFDKIAAYGRVGNEFRWLIDLNHDGVADLTIVDPAGINGIPVAGDFDGNPANGDEVGIFTGSAWHLDTNHDFRVDSMYTTSYGGYPIVGDFDGDGDDDLGTYVASQSGGNQFFIDLNRPAPGGRLHVDGNANHTFRIGMPQLGSGFHGFPGVRERPIAADMNGDGVDDIGLWVPDGAALVPGDQGEWFILVSNDDPSTPVVENTVLDRIDNGFVQFRPQPFGQDIYAQYGNSYALPVVGNFDPPGAAKPTTNVTPARNAVPLPQTNAPAPAPATTRVIHAPAVPDTKEFAIANASPNAEGPQKTSVTLPEASQTATSAPDKNSKSKSGSTSKTAKPAPPQLSQKETQKTTGDSALPETSSANSKPVAIESTIADASQSVVPLKPPLSASNPTSPQPSPAASGLDEAPHQPEAVTEPVTSKAKPAPAAPVVSSATGAKGNPGGASSAKSQLPKTPPQKPAPPATPKEKPAPSVVQVDATLAPVRSDDDGFVGPLSFEPIEGRIAFEEASSYEPMGPKVPPFDTALQLASTREAGVLLGSPATTPSGEFTLAARDAAFDSLLLAVPFGDDFKRSEVHGPSFDTGYDDLSGENLSQATEAGINSPNARAHRGFL